MRKFQSLGSPQPRIEYQTKRMISNIIIKSKSQVLRKRSRLTVPRFSHTSDLNAPSLQIQFDLYLAATLGTLKSGRLIEVGRLTEVQYKLDRKGSKHDFMASIK